MKSKLWIRLFESISLTLTQYVISIILKYVRRLEWASRVWRQWWRQL